MAYIKYEYDPNDPQSEAEARLKACGEMLLGIILIWGSLGCIVYYSCCLISLFEVMAFKNVFFSLGALAIVSVVDFFILFGERTTSEKKQMAKRYFLFWVGGTVELSGIIAIVVSVYTLCHRGDRVVLLICTVLILILNTIVTILIYRKLEGCERLNIRLFTEKNTTDLILGKELEKEKKYIQAYTASIDKKFIYCHECGKRLPSNSAFCSSCGIKLR